jgi:hypothetical protein
MYIWKKYERTFDNLSGTTRGFKIHSCLFYKIELFWFFDTTSIIIRSLKCGFTSWKTGLTRINCIGYSLKIVILWSCWSNARELIGEFIGKRQLYRDWFVEANPRELTGNLSFNSNTEAVELLKQNPIKLIGADYHLMTARKRLSCWSRTPIKLTRLSFNDSKEAVELLKQHPDKIEWRYLSSNANTEAVELLKQNPDKINWFYLSHNTNKNSLEMLKKAKSR